MGEQSAPVAAGERHPPIAPELTEVGAGYTWRFGEGQGAGPTVDDAAHLPAPDVPDAPDETESLRAQIAQLSAALEDVVALALSSADYKERAIMMHRRAVAALSAVKSGPKRPGSA